MKTFRQKYRIFSNNNAPFQALQERWKAKNFLCEPVARIRNWHGILNEPPTFLIDFAIASYGLRALARP